MPYIGNPQVGFISVDTIDVSGTIDGRDVSVDGTKLDTIETSATADQTNTEIRTAVEAASDSNVFTDADHSKLNGIEASADVTDATNVASAGALMTSGGTVTGDVNFGDNDKAIFGAGSDLQIHHNANNSVIEDLGTGNLKIKSNGSGINFQKGDAELLATMATDGAVTLYHDNSAKIATTSSGVSVTGGVVASGGLSINSYGDPSNNYITLRPSFAPSASGGVGFAAKDHDGANNDGLGVFGHDGISFTTGGSERMRLTSAGSLGLGTSSPESYYADELVVSAPTEGGITIASTGTTNTAYLAFADGTSGADRYRGTVQYNHNTDSMRFATNSDTRMTIDSSGNVGIGLTPSQKLDVSGAAQISFVGGVNTFQYFQSTSNYVGRDTSGDFNVGVAGSQSIKFSIGGSEKMRLSGGNLLVGKTASNIATEGIELRANDDVLITQSGDTCLYLNRLSSDGSIVDFRKDGSTAGLIGAFDSGVNLYIGSGDTGVTFNPNVNGILPHNPSTNAQLDNAIDLGYSTVRFKHGYFANTVYTASVAGITDNDTYINFANNNIMQFITNGSERARFTSGGNFRINQSSTDSPGLGNTTIGVCIRSDNIVAISSASGYVSVNRNSDGTIQQFNRSGNTRGSITITSSGTTYNTTSDRRLKQDIEPLAATDKLMAMNPVSYNWKADPDGPRSMGFIAQEMADVMPEAVSTGDDDDAMMSMDYGRITPILASALQDAHRKIERLEQRLADMEAGNE